MVHKNKFTSALTLVMVASAIALVVIPLAFQSWLINAWSVMFSHHAFNPQTNQAVLANPPIGHNRSELWMAFDSIRFGDPKLAERLIADKAEHGDTFAKKLLADALIAQDDVSRALKIWQEMGDMTSINRIAFQKEQAGNFDDALQAYETAWKMDVESNTMALANFLINSKQDYTAAEFVLKSSMATNPLSEFRSDWSSRLGDILRFQKRWDEAQVAYQSSLEDDYNDWSAHIGLGWVYYERDDALNKALNEFEFAILNPESKGFGQYSIGLVLTRENRYSEANTWLEQAIVVNPENRWFYLARGNAARVQGDPELAIDLYQEAIILFPDFAQLYHEMALAYQLNYQIEEAMAACEQAVLLISSPNLEVYLRAGSIFEKGGDFNRALDAYHHVLQIDPNNVTALAGIGVITESNP